MTADEFRQRRHELKLYQGNLAGQLAALGLELPGGQKIDQPAVSMMERGKLPIPEAVAAAMRANVAPGSDAPPPVGEGRSDGAGGGQRRTRKRVSRKAPAAAAGAETPPAPPEPGAPAQPAPMPEPPPPPTPDAPPVPPSPAPPAGDKPPTTPEAKPLGPKVTWDDAAKSQLEADLRDFFAGQHFLVPVRVEVAPGEHEIRHQQGFIPGVAQLAGAVGGDADEQAITLYAASMAHAWAELADENAGVRRFLLGMTYGGAWRGVMMATLPVVLGLAGNHGIGLPSFLGGGQPVSLEP